MYDSSGAVSGYDFSILRTEHGRGLARSIVEDDPTLVGQSRAVLLSAVEDPRRFQTYAALGVRFHAVLSRSADPKAREYGALISTVRRFREDARGYLLRDRNAEMSLESVFAGYAALSRYVFFRDNYVRVLRNAGERVHELAEILRGKAGGPAVRTALFDYGNNILLMAADGAVRHEHIMEAVNLAFPVQRPLLLPLTISSAAGDSKIRMELMRAHSMGELSQAEWSRAVHSVLDAFGVAAPRIGIADDRTELEFQEGIAADDRAAAGYMLMADEAARSETFNIFPVDELLPQRLFQSLYDKPWFTGFNGMAGLLDMENSYLIAARSKEARHHDLQRHADRVFGGAAPFFTPIAVLNFAILGSMHIRIMDDDPARLHSVTRRVIAALDSGVEQVKFHAGHSVVDVRNAGGEDEKNLLFDAGTGQSSFPEEEDRVTQDDDSYEDLVSGANALALPMVSER